MPNEDQKQSDLDDVFNAGVPLAPPPAEESAARVSAVDDVMADVLPETDISLDDIEETATTMAVIPEPVTAPEPAFGSRLSVGELSRPLLGVLPLARVIPQDVHSVMDYVDAASVLAGAALSDCPRARAASVVIGSAGLGASAISDYRLSLAKVIPIEAHETIDYAFGLSAIAAPFVLGYRKTAPLVATLHVALGIGTIVASLLTDYRAYRGAGRGVSA